MSCSWNQPARMGSSSGVQTGRKRKCCPAVARPKSLGLGLLGLRSQFIQLPDEFQCSAVGPHRRLGTGLFACRSILPEYLKLPAGFLDLGEHLLRGFGSCKALFKLGKMAPVRLGQPLSGSKDFLRY